MALLSPGDAEVALRTFPRRWRALLGGLDPDDPDTEVRLRRVGPDGRSALAAAASAAVVLERADGHVRKAVSSEQPVLDPGAEPGELELAESLRRIDAAAPALAATVAGIAAGDLDRPADLGGRAVSVRSLMADAVQQVADLLRSADRSLHGRS